MSVEKMTRALLRKLIPARFRPARHLERLVRRRTNDQVRSGPFSGMRCLPGTNGVHIPKWLGIYERELYPFIEKACELDFELITVAGAAEGYYAIGMARRNPHARIVAFEMEPVTRQFLTNAAKLNDVSDRIDIRGKCEPTGLEKVLANGQSLLLICDVEGDESVLLDPESLPSLKRATILVELHEFVERGISSRVRERFSDSHTIIEIWQEDRVRSDFPFNSIYTSLLPDSYLNWAVGESRPERMSWFWMEPLR